MFAQSLTDFEAVTLRSLRKRERVTITSCSHHDAGPMLLPKIDELDDYLRTEYLRTADYAPVLANIALVKDVRTSYVRVGD